MAEMNIGIVGCGVISAAYLDHLRDQFPWVHVAACTDKFPEKARERADAYGIRSISYDEMMESPEIDLILNLTTPQQHVSVSCDALMHGKHVYSEKPLALSVEDGKRILALAREKGLKVGCAPDMFLGGSVQALYSAIRDGRIGKPVAGTAGWSSPGHEQWHTNPAFYYKAGGGPVLDMGPYYITALAGALGSVRRVCGMSRRTYETRTVTAPGPLNGTKIPVEIDTHYNAVLEYENGTVVSLLLSFDLWTNSIPRMEIYGTEGTLLGPDPNTLEGAPMIRSSNDDCFRELPLANAFTGNIRGIGVAQMCSALAHGEEIRASGELALHVLDVLLCIEKACHEGITVECTTRIEGNADIFSSLNV